MLESVHDADHDGVVRIFVGVSCKLGGFFNYITLHYAEQIFYYQECNHHFVCSHHLHIPLVVSRTLKGEQAQKILVL